MAKSSFDEQYYALLASRIRTGDGDAFAELYGATYDTLYRSVYYFLRNPDDIRDALQEIYMAVYTNIGSLKIDRLLLPWMRQIAYHVCCDYARKNKLARDMSVELHDDFVPAQAADVSLQQVYDRDAWAWVRKALDACPVKERQAFLLRYESGLKLEEIAAFMGVSLASVKRYINSAKETLQQVPPPLLDREVTPLCELFFVVPPFVCCWGFCAALAVSATFRPRTSSGTGPASRWCIPPRPPAVPCWAKAR